MKHYWSNKICIKQILQKKSSRQLSDVLIVAKDTILVPCRRTTNPFPMELGKICIAEMGRAITQDMPLTSLDLLVLMQFRS
jgi:hypothetical protein